MSNEEYPFSFTYAPLISTLHIKKVSKKELQEAIGTSSATIAKISKDQPVSMKILNDICHFLNCNIEDVIEHRKDS
ncbi:helix-turn-helix transcriptional regulator [Schinkia azotoformans]|uniref:helix-turn-helix domain-containing protein n=1 Tax=Schinkia azotoformans TaxID=1454 RepID=UPI002E1A2751|nr:helix-turn-helix transcriptional regulator [Schinkia azotoformans]